MAEDHVEDRGGSSPATRLLDALGRGDLDALLAEFRPTTIIRTEDRSWSVQGEDDVVFWLETAFDRFPGLVFDSHSRHIGYGQVIEEARVRDIDLEQPSGGPGGPGAGASDHAGAEADGPAGGALLLDREFGTSDTPRLNMPLRLTVLHDDRFVHEIIASYPRALLQSALGQHVDPLDLALSEIQSAFVASAGSGFKTYQMGDKPSEVVPMPIVAPEHQEVRAREPEPEQDPARLAPRSMQEMFAPIAAAAAVHEEPVVEVLDEEDFDDEPAYDDEDVEPDPEPEPAEEPWQPPPYVYDDDEEKPRRRALVVVPVVIAIIAAVAGTMWWIGRDSNTVDQAGGKPHKGAHASQSGKNDNNKPTKKPSSPSPSKPVATKTAKPTVTLKSDLAFPKNSAVLSTAAKAAITHLAGEVRKAHLRGTISINGYTDNLGSAAHGQDLSQQRAAAVASYLRHALDGYQIHIVAFGHGEDDPIASNATEAGRQKNRRVTITLPKN